MPGIALLVACTLGVVDARAQDDVRRALQEQIERLMFEQDFAVEGVRIISGDMLPALYADREYRPLWPSRERILDLESAVALAYSEGLDRDDYPLDRVLALLPAEGLPANPRDRAKLDILATETFVRVGYQLRFGKVNPNGMFPNWNFRRELSDGQTRNQTIESAVAAPTFEAFFQGWLVRGPLYAHLKDALARYREIETAGGWDSVPAGATLREGDTDPRVVDLRKRLRVEGDLGEAEPLDNPQLDAGVKAAVVRFQDRHGLDSDGVVGQQSYVALNVPIRKRIDQLRASLERGRWIFDELRASHGGAIVLVNIASAEVGVLSNGRALLRLRAQVGKAYRQTPVFKGDIQYLVVNPDWTVPPGILSKDVLPKLKANADAYLTQKNMVLLDREGNPVDHTAVDWASIGARGFPYIVRQRPGPWNALGQVKFIFPNPHFVFLHDTPSRELFDRSARAFSSGCIRVEEPFRLAELVLADPRWDQAALMEVLATRKLRTIHLARPMPVFVLYWTGMAEADGTVRFFADIYGRDDKLIEALDADPVMDMARQD